MVFSFKELEVVKIADNALFYTSFFKINVHVAQI